MTTINTTLLRGRVKLIQPAEGYHASMDAVFLAAAVEPQKNAQVLDLGCGVGTVGFCLLARNPHFSLTGIDVQTDLIDLARQNARLNGWDDRCDFIAGDLASKTLVPQNTFDEAVMNPPFYTTLAYSPGRHQRKTRAHAEGAATPLLEWLRRAHHGLKQAGYVTMILPPERLTDALTAMTARRWFGSIVIHPLWPRKGESAKRLIIRARKERYGALRLTHGTVLHTASGGWTVAAKNVLEKAAALEL